MIWEGVVALCVTKRQFLNRFNTADFHKMRQSMTITADLSLCWALSRCMISATVLTVRSLSLLASPVLLLRAPLTSLRGSRRTFLMIAFAVNPWRSYVYGDCFILANTLDCSLEVSVALHMSMGFLRLRSDSRTGLSFRPWRRIHHKWSGHAYPPLQDFQIHRLLPLSVKLVNRFAFLLVPRIEHGTLTCIIFARIAA